MLCVNSYPSRAIESARKAITDQIALYKRLPTDPDFESAYLSNLVVVLDAMFMHRSRALELQDGNPCNEVRLLSSSIINNGAMLTLDKSIKYKADKAVLKLEPGAPIRLNLKDFDALQDAYFKDITLKFSQ